MGPTDNINYIEIPDDAVIIKQSIWSWLLMSVPWILFFLISLIVDFLTFGILPIILAAAMIVPRYISSNKTSYILVDNYIIVDQGAGRRIDIPISDIDFVTLKYGMFGRTLGYATFLLNLKVSTQKDIVDEINSILPIQYVPQTKFKDLELHITKFSKNSPYIFNQAESKKTNKIIDSNSNIIEDDIQEDN